MIQSADIMSHSISFLNGTVKCPPVFQKIQMPKTIFSNMFNSIVIVLKYTHTSIHTHHFYNVWFLKMKLLICIYPTRIFIHVVSFGDSFKFNSHKYIVSYLVVSDSLRPHGLQPARLLCPWNSPTLWSGLPFSSPRDLPNAGTGSGSPALQADPLPMSYQGSPPSFMFLTTLMSKKQSFNSELYFKTPFLLQTYFFVYNV